MAGRPLKEINWDVVEKLIECGCSGPEIAGKFKITDDTFYRRFKNAYDCDFGGYRAIAQRSGKADIRAMLYAKAINNNAPGNAGLLIFLARCELGMKEPEQVHLVAANQDQIDESQLIMQLQHENAELKANANQPQAE